MASKRAHKEIISIIVKWGIKHRETVFGKTG